MLHRCHQIALRLFLVSFLCSWLFSACGSSAVEIPIHEAVLPTATPSIITSELAPIALPTPTPLVAASNLLVDPAQFKPDEEAEPAEMALTGADQNNQTETPTNPDLFAWEAIDPSGQQVVFWHRYTKFREKVLAEIIADFNTSNPYGIFVTGIYQGDSGELFDKTISVLNAPETPNIVLGYQSDLATYFLSGGLVALDGLLDSPQWGLNEEERADFYQPALDSDVFAPFAAARLGIAPERALEVIYVNTEWLSELGITQLPEAPEAFKTAACAAAQRRFSRARNPVSQGYALAANATTFANWSFAFGGDLFDGSTNQFTLASASNQAAMTFLQELVQGGCATLVSERYGDQTDFGNGDALFAVGASSSLYFFGKAIDEGAAFQWTVLPLPHTTEQPTLNLRGGSAAILHSTPERTLAAWLFLKHYLSSPMQAKWAKATGNYPVRASAADDLADYFVENPAYQRGFTWLKTSRAEPAVPGYGMIRGVLQAALLDILDGADVATRLQQADAEANRILSEQMSAWQP